MALSASTTLPAPVQRVTDVFTDEDFVRDTAARVGGELKSYEVSGPTTGAFSTKTVRTLPTDRLPEMARKFVGATLTVTSQEQWSAPAVDGSRQADITLSVTGAPLNVTAVQRLVPQGEGCLVELTGEVTSSIPFLGAKIAAVAEPVVGRALNVQATMATAWLESHPA